MIILIDPGHGGTDPGAVGNGLKEKDLTLQIAKAIKALLAPYDVTVYLTRERDETVSLKQRTDAANKWNVDFFLSIHINAGGGVGFESFIYNKLLNDSATDRMRNAIHDGVMTVTDFRDRGKKKANFHVLRETRMPACLTESGFIDNAGDANKLKDGAYIANIALGHANGLIRAFDLKRKATTAPISNDDLYRVQVGAFAKKENATKLADDLKKHGYQVYITK